VLIVFMAFSSIIPMFSKQMLASNEANVEWHILICEGLDEQLPITRPHELVIGILLFVYLVTPVPHTMFMRLGFTRSCYFF
jgi:hypothetical protein